MIIQCHSCRTRYHYDESRFAGLPSKKIRCTKCASVFEIRNPAFAAVPDDYQPDETHSHGPALGSDDFALDTTVMGGPRKRSGTVPTSPPRASSAPVVVPPPLPQQAAAPGAPRAASGYTMPPPVPQAPPAKQPPTETDAYARPSSSSVEGEERPLRLPDWYRLSLACIAGPDSGRIFEIDRPRVVIGRANSDVLLTDAQCSRQHSAVEVQGDEAWIVDLNSTNGTWVGERRVNRYPLDNRTEFDVGATTLMFIKTRKD